MNAGRRLSASACTWCGHDQHTGPGACPVVIQTGNDKAPDAIGCPCARRGESARRVAGALAHLLTPSGDVIGGAE